MSWTATPNSAMTPPSLLRAVPESLRSFAVSAVDQIPLGLYELPRRSGEAHLYRLAHPLAEAVVAQAKSRELAPAEVRFSYEEHEGIISHLEDWRNIRAGLRSPTLASSHLTSGRTTFSCRNDRHGCGAG
jgi:hypothetical protein